MGAGDVLAPPVQRFVDELSPVLAGLSPNVGAREVAVEAFDLVASFIDADGRHTDAELSELLVALAPWLDHLAGVTPADVRNNDLVAGKRAWKLAPSPLFDVLIAHDQQAGTNDAWRYYELAMLIAHTVCSLDDYAAADELADINAFRTTLLGAMKQADVARPLPGDQRAVTAAREATKEPELPPKRSLEDLLAELDDLVGLEAVKAEVRLVSSFIQVQRMRKERGLPAVEGSRHLVFTGNPGTGKTTVARLLAQIYRTLEVVDKGHLVETDRSGLVAGFVGQTAIQVRTVVESALGGVLLIDEAYALAGGGEQDFGREAVATLVKLMEDHREDVVIIAAGYTEEMEKFIDSNPGLRSRFPKTIHFDDYSNEELVAIFASMCDKSHYRCPEPVKEKLLSYFVAQPRGRGFGNGRLARNLFERAIALHAQRVVEVKSPTDDQLMTLETSDIPA
jgi:AAA+ superfamily predicted ATPase